jgi:hypothetical protein
MTKEFNVERNYRIDNSDPYMKARFNQTVIPDEGETIEDAALRAISQLDNIFRMAYPHVAEHLNFHIVKQVKENGYKMPEMEAMKSLVDSLPTKVEKINKGTIEEQIQAFNGTVEELKREWYYIAMMNKKATTAYNEKLSELESKLKTNKQEPTY